VIIFSGSLPATRLAVQDMDPLLFLAKADQQGDGKQPGDGGAQKGQ
jgi:hypothetical protein